jgi:hypothetical protein
MQAFPALNATAGDRCCNQRFARSLSRCNGGDPWIFFRDLAERLRVVSVWPACRNHPSLCSLLYRYGSFALAQKGMGRDWAASTPSHSKAALGSQSFAKRQTSLLFSRSLRALLFFNTVALIHVRVRWVRFRSERPVAAGTRRN